MKNIIKILITIFLISCSESSNLEYNLFELKKDIGYTEDRGDKIGIIHTYRKERLSLPKGTQIIYKFTASYAQAEITNGRFKGNIVDMTFLKKDERLEYLSLIKVQGDTYAFEENIKQKH